VNIELSISLDVSQQILDLYISIKSKREDVSLYTRIKIALNEQAQQRGEDSLLDDATKEQSKPKNPDWEFDGTSNPLDTVNTNHHTVSYHFSNS
jgi:CTD kinase subunit beta